MADKTPRGRAIIMAMLMTIKVPKIIGIMPYCPPAGSQTAESKFKSFENRAGPLWMSNVPKMSIIIVEENKADPAA